MCSFSLVLIVRRRRTRVNITIEQGTATGIHVRPRLLCAVRGRFSPGRHRLPEAAYFAEENGVRTGFIFLDLKDVSQIPAIAEPWFLAFDARVEIHPAMNIGDLKKAAPGIERSVKNHRVAQTKAA